ncbi:MAG TPA: GH1 family beta-glucosidase [Spirochaetia bacterium]|nr:GH1 family beta-glucosidase [Spirochaetia bacterium]
MATPRVLNFPPGFAWGTATAAYQVEGAVSEDGRGTSIWDTYCRQPGRILGGTSGDTTCDHYHRFAEDFRLMRDLGIRAYRFSISWPRVIPAGSGSVNARGLDFYERLVDCMRENGIEPFATLYHWDLPQPLQDAGGWPNRATADRYVEYVDVVTRRLGKKVRRWMTHNEPWVVAFVGNLYGAHAPGLTDLKTALAAAHTLLLSHGKAVPVIRANGGSGTQVGIVHNLEWIEPASRREADRSAAARHDGAFNRWFLDPVFRGSYPADMLAWYGKNAPEVKAGDLEAMKAPLDFLGVNYYTRRIIAHDPAGDFLHVRRVALPFVPHADYEEWEVNPEGLYRLLVRVSEDYGRPPIYVTESGTPLPDVLGPDGACHDPTRVDYLSRHAAAIWQANQDGADVRGYFVWSILDNFEWNLGFTKRFGLVHVDFKTQKRTVKDSGRWYSDVVKENRVTV